MAKLIIDDIAVEVPAGTNVLEAAKLVGIVIPHFCYHPALGSVGACRLCAMKFLDGPVKGMQMSCMIPAQDGMVISTGDPEAVRMRQIVIEWLMINHPHDCPICDEGGECQLQDYTIAGGHAIRRHTGKKRTFLNQYLGPHIEHEMNRCIECYRCSRFYQDFAGGTDLGVMGSAGRVYFGRFREGTLESPFSGNLLDICPTGVYTDKGARFRARYWDYEMAPSICPHCSLGCNTLPAARHRELLKISARRNDEVNGWFICDRGRFDSLQVNDPARPRVPLVDGSEVSWEDALDALCLRLQEFRALGGSGGLAVVGSSRLSHEAAVLLPRLADLTGAGSISYFVGEDATLTHAAVSILNGDNAASMADIAEADCIVVHSSDILQEGAMLGLALRQAWRKGAKIYAVGSGAAENLGTALSVTVTAADGLTAIPLHEFKSPVILSGTAGTTPEDLEDAGKTGAALAFGLSGPNACGAAMVSLACGGTSLASAIATGKVRGILAFEADIPEELLRGIPFITVADWMPTVAVQKGTIVLPTAAWLEMDGTYINNEGRAQRFRKVMNPGEPVKGIDPAVHPPHIPRIVPPGGDVRAAWRILSDLLERLGQGPEHPFSGRWEKLRELDPEGPGLKVWPEKERV